MRRIMTQGAGAGGFYLRVLLLVFSITMSMTSMAQPVITSPTANTTLTGTTQTFTWADDNVEVERYWLYAGSSPGASDIANSGDLGKNPQYDAIGIPVDGTAVHVRLWYNDSDQWRYTDSVYTAALLGNVATPALLTPVDGETLRGGSAAFEWSDNNTPVNLWWLYLGSRQGGNDLYNSGPNLRNRTSVMVNQLPINGTEVHARLWFRTAADGWRFADTAYPTANDDGDSDCAMPAGATLEEIDFRTLTNVDPFIDRSTWLRAVYPSSAPDFMSIINEGLQLRYDADQGIGFLDNPYRAELRQTDSGPPQTGTTQVYRIQFSMNELPSTLYGPLVIFQRFNDGLDSPDLTVELSSVYQFPSTAAPNSIQVIHNFGGQNERQRFVNTYLQERNELLVAVHNAQNGGYVVFLNGQELARWSELDTRAGAPAWLQYGIYWHGVIRSNYSQRAEQVASGESIATMTHHRIEKYEYPAAIDFNLLNAHDPNVSGFRCL